ncbi:MAG: TIR domain-containing protein [Verrucomicrobia bacterium]|nr:TIR domain-containing protein [Verrucomicrobiota bacterium]
MSGDGMMNREPLDVAQRSPAGGGEPGHRRQSTPAGIGTGLTIEPGDHIWPAPHDVVAGGQVAGSHVEGSGCRVEVSDGERQNVEYKYWAFISYSHADRAWGQWLHHSLETYRLPRSLVGKSSRDGVVPRRLFPIFRDREELSISADLGANLKNALRRSRYLVVICSPRAAKSCWVNEEIRYFKSLQAEERVLCFIVAGQPNAADTPHSQQEECFPDAARFRVGTGGTLTDVRTEPLAVDVRKRGDGKRNAKLKTIAGLAGVNFDDLKRREQRRRLWQKLRIGSLIVMLTAFIISLVQFEEIQKEEQATNARVQKYIEAGQDKINNGKYLQAAAYFAAAYHQRKGFAAMPEGLQEGLNECAKALVKQTRVLTGHTHWVSSAAFTNDGQKLVTASWDKTIRRWDVNTGAANVVARSTAKLVSINLSPDGTRLVGASWDSNAYVWDLDGNLVATLDGHRNRVNYAAFSPDGQRIVTASDDNTARVWLTNGTPVFTMKDTDVVKSSVYSPDGTMILTAGFSGMAKIWDSASGQLIRRIAVGQSELNFAVFNPEGKGIATVGFGSEVIIWDLEGRKVGAFGGIRGRVNSVQFDHSGKFLVTASDEDGAKVWDIDGGQLWMSLERHQGKVLSAAFSPDDSRLVTTGDDKTARIWETQGPKRGLAETVAAIEEESPWKLVNDQLVDDQLKEP